MLWPGWRSIHEVILRRGVVLFVESVISWGSIPTRCAIGVFQVEIDEGHRPGVTTAEAHRIAELVPENRELRRANEILRTASASFAAAELDRKLK